MMFTLLCVFMLFSSVLCSNQVTNCEFIDRNIYDVRLSCVDFTGPLQPLGCFNACFKQKYLKDKVQVLKIGDCRGNRLNPILNQFQYLHTFNIFQHGIDLLLSSDLNFHNLHNFNASHNELVVIFAATFEYTPKLTKIDLSFNKIVMVESRTFSRLVDLQTLDLRANLIETIADNMFEFNTKLEVLRLGRNPIRRFDGNIFRPLLKSINIVDVTWQNVKELDTSHLKGSLKIELKKNEVIFGTPTNSSILRCPNGSFKNMNYFNISGNEQQNTLKLVQLLGSTVETLDLTGNYIAKSNDNILNLVQILGKFNNLTYLSVSRMNLSKITFGGASPKKEWNLKTLDLSSNQLNSLNFVGKFENLEKFDASHNRFSNIPAKLFDSLPNVTELNWSFNKIATFDNETFAKLTHLCLLDLRNNEIQSIDKNFFENNPKLKELRLENNRIVRFDCNIFPILQNSLSDVQKSTNFESDWETLEELDLSCMGNLHLELDHEFGVLLRGSYNFVFRFAKETFRHLKYFNISGLHLENTSKLLALLGPSLQKLDISANFVGALNAHTFETFENLQVLNVSQTNLSNFGFETFYHQRKLSQLDLSYNQLKKVNFTLLFRNFKELKTLNLEGNDLVELNTVTHLIFPNLTSLAISRNRFSCDYLAILLLQWHNLHLVNNPSNQTHIDGVDCYHDKGQSNEKLSEVDKSVETKTEITTEIEKTSTEVMDFSENSTEYSTVSEIHMDHSQETNIEHNYYLLELRIVEFLLVVSVVVSVGLCILLRRKQKTRKMECNSKGSKQIARSGPHDIELIEHDVFNE